MSPRTVGRVLGMLLLLQSALAPVVYFRLLAPGSRSTFLESAAASAAQVRLGILLAYLLGAMTLAAAIITWPIVRRGSERLALGLVVLAVVDFAAFGMENLVLRQMLGLSVQHAAAQAPGVLAELAPLLREQWRQAHFTQLLFANAFGFLLHLTLFRLRLVPRLITGAGMAAGLLGIGNVTAPLMGGRFGFALMAPVGLAQLALVGWLLARGLAQKPGAAPVRMGTP